MMTRIIIAAIIIFCCATEAVEETSQDGAIAILKLIKARNYSDFFQH